MKLLHHRLCSNNVKGTIADKTKNLLAHVILTDLKFKRDVFLNFHNNFQNNLDNFYCNSLSGKSTKWSNTLKQFVGKSQQIV